MDLLTRGLQIWLDSNSKGTYIKRLDEVDTLDIVQVASTAIEEVGYDLATKILSVRFLESGANYDYFNVPEDIYTDLINAGSIGSEFNFSVKGNYFYSRA